MTRWPTVVDSQVWTTPISAVAAATPTMAPTSQSSRRDVLPGERVVDEAADEERLGQPDRGAGDDQADDDGEAAP